MATVPSCPDCDTGDPHILAFYRRQQPAYRKQEGKDLTFANFFKSQTYMKEILSAQLPRSMRKTVKSFTTQ